MRDATGRIDSLLVLGGTSDIGLATAGVFAERGARRIMLAARDPDRALQRAKPLAAAGASVEAIALDAEDSASHASFVEEVFAAGHDVDLVLFAFGVLARDPDAETALTMARVNYLASLSLGLPLAERLRAQGHGVIAALSSIAAVRPRPSNFVYGSTKAATDAFFRGLGDRLRGTGVNVIVVRPGFVRSAMTAGMPDQPLAVEPTDVGLAIARGVERGARTVWVPRPMRLVAAGIRAAPLRVIERLD